MFGFGKSKLERLKEQRAKLGHKVTAEAERYKVRKDIHNIESARAKRQTELDKWNAEKPPSGFGRVVQEVKQFQAGAEDRQKTKIKRMKLQTQEIKAKKALMKARGGGTNMMGSMGFGGQGGSIVGVAPRPPKKGPRNLIDL